ncbi:HAD-IIA family hydrolase [soil metagenome]
MTWLLDLDGVVWLAERPLPGAAEAVARLLRAGVRVLFVTNNSAFRMAEQEAKLASQGISAEGDVLTSAMAAAGLAEPGTAALVAAGAGVVEALGARGVRVVDGPPADVVVVGFTRAFTYDLLERAATAVLGGARLIGTNDDATYPTPDGPIPGGGSLLAAVAYATGAEPEVAGKPFAPMVDLARSRSGDGVHTVVGDRPSTDGRFARALGARFALVLRGVARAGDDHDPEPDVVADDIASLVQWYGGGDQGSVLGEA